MLRVNHAGELGANAIYQGQLKGLALSQPSNSSLHQMIQVSLIQQHQQTGILEESYWNIQNVH